MPIYRYTAMDANGAHSSSVLEAENKEAFYKYIRERGQFCIDVKEVGAQHSMSLSSKKVKLKDLSIFCRQFSTMLNSGATVIKCLDILYQQTENKLLREHLLAIYEDVQKGESLSKAMKRRKNAFPVLLINMIESGEAGGSLDSVMQRMAETFEKDLKMQNKVRQALVYPAFLLGLTIVVVIFLLTFILPRFTGMFAQLGGNLPAPTQILLNISGFLTQDWYVVIAVIVLAVILWRAFIKSDAGRLKWDEFKVKVPVVGKVVMKLVCGRFARTLSSLVSSGMPIIQALEITGRVINNRFAESHLMNIIEDVRHGTSLSAAIKKTGQFPVMLFSMVRVGEESGNLDSVLVKTSMFYDEESDAAIQKLISLIEPIMIVLLAFIVGFIIISIIVPIYTLYQQLSASTAM